MSDSSNRRRGASALSGLLVLVSLLILPRAAPIVLAYAGKFRAAHDVGAILPVVGGVAALFGLLFLGIWRWRPAAAVIGGLVLLLLVARSGNAVALLTSLVLLGLTLLAGDWLSRLLRGWEAGAGELSVLMAAGCAVIGCALLLLSQVGLARPLSLAVAALALVVARRNRIIALLRHLRAAVRSFLLPSGSAVEALWLAIFAAVVIAGLLGALRPEASWDALAYHLPEARDFAEHGRVEPLPNL